MGRPVPAFVVLIGALAVTAAAAASAAARPPREPVRWAPAASAAIHPGVQTFTGGNQCTANFVYQEITPDETNVYIGQAAHCSGAGVDVGPDGCSTPSLPEGTPVD